MIPSGLRIASAFIRCRYEPATSPSMRFAQKGRMGTTKALESHCFQTGTLHKASEVRPELPLPRMRFIFEYFSRRPVMRAPIVVVITSLLLAACGTSHKTVVVAPPAGSTTVVDQNGDAHVVDRDR